MSCRLCGKGGPIKAWVDFLASTPDLPGYVRADLLRPARKLELDVAFSELRNAAKLGCSFCSVVTEGVLRFADSNGDDIMNISLWQGLEYREEDRLGEQELLRVTFRSRTSGTNYLRFYATDYNVTKMWPHILVAKHLSADCSSSECLLQARKWLDNCIRNHTSYQYRTESRLPTRVICVGDSLTEPYLYESLPDEKGDWAALSYCWGGVQTMKTCVDTLSERKSSIPLDALPKTCRDALLVARALSIPYVWIDALCIIQDSLEDWVKEAARMCYIYENAVVTFAAPDSPTADSGLFLSIPQRRTIKIDRQIDGRAVAVFVRRDLNQRTFSGHRHGIPVNAWGYILASRGWTLQELALTSRILWFGESELSWSCWSSAACECDPRQTTERINPKGDVTPHSTLALRMSFDHPTAPSAVAHWLKVWRGLVTEFTNRKLTVATDRLPALSGLADFLQARVNGAYMAGIWEFDLSIQLLWLCDRTIQEAHGLLDYEYAPSWSWASVSCPVNFIQDITHGRIEIVWEIISTRFKPLTPNAFGAGEGSVTIKGYLLPVWWVDGSLVWNSPSGEEGYIILSNKALESRAIMDPRPKTTNQAKDLMFLVAGMMMKKMPKSAGARIPIVCYGILLELAPSQGAFRRVGYTEPLLAQDPDASATTGVRSWSFWEQKCVKGVVDIV